MVGGLLTLSSCSVFGESDHCEHFAGFFAGFGVDEEVFQEDFWGGGVGGAVLIVEVFFEVVLFADCFEGLADLDGFSVGAGYSVGLWGGGHYDEFEVGGVFRLAFEFEGELGWGEGYDGFGRCFYALEGWRIGEGFTAAEYDPVVEAGVEVGSGDLG